MGLLEDVQKATLPEQEPQSLLAQVQGATPPEAEEPAPRGIKEQLRRLPGLVAGAALIPEPLKLGRVEPPTPRDIQNLSPEERQRIRLTLEVGGGIAATVPTGGASIPLTLGRIGFLGLRAGVGEALGSLVAEPIDPSKSPIAIAKRAAGAGLRGSIGEATGGTFARVGGKFIGGTALEEGAEAAIREVTARGGVVTPGLVSKNWAVDFMEGVLASALTGGGKIRKVREKAVRLIQDAVEAFTEAFSRGATKEDVGALLQGALRKEEDAFLAVGKDLFKAVDEAVEGATVNYQDVKTALRGLKKDFAAQVDVGEATGLIDEVLNKPNFVSFGEAQRLRSSLLRISRKTTDPDRIAVAKQTASLVDNAMESTARGLRGGALLTWRTANKHWKDGLEKFNDTLIKSLTKKEPEAVFKVAIKKQLPGSIRKVRAAVNNEEVWKEAQGQFLRDLLQNATDVKTGEISGTKLLNTFKPSNFGTEAFDATFSKAQRETFQELAKALALVQGKAAKGSPGGMLIQLTQGGAIVGLFTGRAVAQSSAILAIPWGVAHLLTRPVVAKALTVGLKAPAGSQEAARAFGQFVAAYNRNLPEEEALRLPSQPQPRQPRPPRSATFGGPQAPR